MRGPPSPVPPQRQGLFRAPARATFVCGDKSSQKHRLDLRSKNPSRAILSCDFLRILAGIAFCRRCRIKGLCLRSPARRLTRPLASATVGIFRSCRCLLLRQKLFVLPCRRLRNNYILCPTGTPTFAALRRQRRDLIIAKNDQRTSPYPRCCQRQRRKRYKQSPEPTTIPAVPIPRDQHRQFCMTHSAPRGP